MEFRDLVALMAEYKTHVELTYNDRHPNKENLKEILFAAVEHHLTVKLNVNSTVSLKTLLGILKEVNIDLEMEEKQGSLDNLITIKFSDLTA